MKIQLRILLLAVFVSILSGCGAVVTSGPYMDAYADDNIYTTDFYDSSPWWGGTYYTGYTWNNPGVYWGRDYGYWNQGTGYWGYWRADR